MVARADARAGWTLAVVFFVMFLVSLDLSIVNVALPAIDAELDFSESGLSWVINAYLLTFAGLMLLGGRLADLTRRRTLLLVSLAVFAAASGWGGAAHTGWELLSARAIQGVAAAVLAPMSLALVASEFPPGPSRAKAMAVQGAAGAAGGAVGVVLSGVLTEQFGWRSVMWVNVVLVVLVAGIVVRGVANTGPVRRSRPDVPGAVLVTVGATALVLAVISTEHHAWLSTPVLGWFTVGIGALAAFVLVESRTSDPLVPLAFLRRRALIGATVFGFLLASGQFASFYFVSLFAQRVLGYSAIATGLAFLPFCVGVVVGVRIAMSRVSAVGPRPVLLIGGLCGAAGLAWFGMQDTGATFLTGILGPSLVASIGIGACMVAMGMAAITGVPADQTGLASGILNSGRQLGGTLGLAVLVTVATSIIGSATDRPTLVDGYGTALLLAAALLAIGAVAAAVILPGGVREQEPDRVVVDL
ncbi:MFS transporter [Nocardia brasiliensis]|uniref:MFS transporter n=1 Tax=Nocardia brasiliensis TaxID=37326 RepID=UPI00366B2619